MEDRFRALHDLLRLPCGGGEGLIYSTLDRRAWLLGRDELALLARCGAFATLHEHAARAEGPMVSPTAPLGARVAELRALVDKGLLISERELVGGLAAVAALEEAPPPPIELIGIPTRARQAMVLGAVESFASNCAPDRPIEVVVVHDTDRVDESEALCRALAALPVPAHVRLRYSGPEERRAFARQLAAEAQLEEETCAAALLRQHPTLWSAGTCRNTILLESVGALALMIDDDVRSLTARAPVCEPGLALTSTGGVLELWFADAGDLAESLIELAPADVPAQHQRLLGKSLAACVAAAAEPLDVSDAGGSLLRAALAGEGRVRATQMGLVGDAATGSLGHYLLLRGASRERLVVHERVYRHAFESRQLLRSARREAISDGALCMTYALGVDHRELLPPVPPTCRNGDGVFGYVLRHCFRDSYFGFITDVIAHRAEPRTSSFERLLGDLRQIDANDLMCRLITASGIAPSRPEPGHSLGDLGRHLQRLGALPLPALEELVWTTVLRTRSRDLAILREALGAHHHHPPFWAADVERLVEALGRVVVDPAHAQPRDLIAAYGEREGRRWLSRHLADYGRLLEHWPAIEAAARALRAGGVRPSRALSSTGTLAG
jgi:hypothetical protein